MQGNQMRNAVQTARIASMPCTFGANWLPHRPVAGSRSMQVIWSSLSSQVSPVSIIILVLLRFDDGHPVPDERPRAPAEQACDFKSPPFANGKTPPANAVPCSLGRESDIFAVPLRFVALERKGAPGHVLTPSQRRNP